MSNNIPEDVWDKEQIVNGDPTGKEWKKDACRAWIKHDSYGDRNSRFGWEIDHINPNGGDGLDNLRPLHWKNNVSNFRIFYSIHYSYYNI